MDDDNGDEESERIIHDYEDGLKKFGPPLDNTGREIRDGMIVILNDKGERDRVYYEVNSAIYEPQTRKPLAWDSSGKVILRAPPSFHVGWAYYQETSGNEGEYSGWMISISELPTDPDFVNARDCEAIDTLETLIGALAVDHVDIRFKVAKTIGELGDPRCVELLLLALIDEDIIMRDGAAQALGEYGDERAVEPLIKALKDEYKWVCISAAKALGKIGDPHAVESLIELLKNRDVYVCSAAAYALGKIGDKRAVEPLITTLTTTFGLGYWQGDHIRQKAAEALGRIGDERAVGPLIMMLTREQVRVRSIRALGRIGDMQAVGPLIMLLGDKNVHVRMCAANALGILGDELAVEPLIKALKDDESRVIGAAAEALGKIGDKRAVEPLFTVLCEEWQDIDLDILEKNWMGLARVQTAEALGCFNDSRAIKPLITSLGDENERIRNIGAVGLARFGEQIIEPLITAMEDKGGTVVYEDAVLNIVKLGDPQIMKPLIMWLEKWHLATKNVND